MYSKTRERLLNAVSREKKVNLLNEKHFLKKTFLLTLYDYRDVVEKCIYVKVDKLLRQNFNDARNRAARINPRYKPGCVIIVEKFLRNDHIIAPFHSQSCSA